MSTQHEHSWDPEGPVCTEISTDACLTPMVQGEHPTGRLGFWFGHELPGGGPRCMGAVPTVSPDGGPTWQQTGTLEGGDLTLSPSVNCIQPTGAGRDRHGRDFHGWVHDGKWVTA